MKILIIEDDPAVSEVIALTLGDLGHHTHVANDVNTGAGLIETLDDLDLLVIDFDLGGARTGADLSARFRERLPRGSILMITGQPALARQSRGPGDDVSVLSKPFRISELMLALERLEPERFSGDAISRSERAAGASYAGDVGENAEHRPVPDSESAP